MIFKNLVLFWSQPTVDQPAVGGGGVKRLLENVQKIDSFFWCLPLYGNCHEYQSSAIMNDSNSYVSADINNLLTKYVVEDRCFRLALDFSIKRNVQIKMCIWEAVKITSINKQHMKLFIKINCRTDKLCRPILRTLILWPTGADWIMNIKGSF